MSRGYTNHSWPTKKNVLVGTFALRTVAHDHLKHPQVSPDSGSWESTTVYLDAFFYCTSSNHEISRDTLQKAYVSTPSWGQLDPSSCRRVPRGFRGLPFFELMGPKPWMKDDAMQSNQVLINRTLKKQQHVLVVLTLALWGQRFIQQPALGHWAFFLLTFPAVMWMCYTLWVPEAVANSIPFLSWRHPAPPCLIVQVVPSTLAFGYLWFDEMKSPVSNSLIITCYIAKSVESVKSLRPNTLQ